MPGSLSDDIIIDFINELKDYIPELRGKVRQLREHGGAAVLGHIEELHRLVHTIRGASSLVKLNHLNEVASEFESVLNEIVGKHLEFDVEANDAFSKAIDYFEAYANQSPCDDSFDQKLKADVLTRLLDIRKHADAGNGKDLLSQILETARQDRHDQIALNDREPAIDDFELDAEHLLMDEDDVVHVADNDLHDVSASSLQTPDAGSDLSDAKTEDDLHRDDSISEAIDLPQQELLEGFYQEAEDHFQDLGKALGQLEDQITSSTRLTAEYRELLRIIRRSVHTIKGAAAVIKLKAVSGWGHEFEDVLDWLYEKASRLSPATIEIIAAAADMLERFVTTPQEVDPDQKKRLRAEFKQIIGTDAEDADAPISIEELSGTLPEVAEEPLADEAEVPAVFKAATGGGPNSSNVSIGTPRTLRVDMAKVESLVNLGGELTIALSAFDQDMDGLGGLIGEVDRARVRLKRTARDLEMGYEVKAIQRLGSGSAIVDAPTAAAGASSAAFSDFDLLELDRYSELNLIIRSLSETAVDVNTISQQLSDIYSGFDAYLNRLRILLSELHEKTMRIRMTPMATIVNRMRRTVRETAAQVNKKVHFIVQGEHTELDKLVWEKLADPLMHLLRNAVDHGIESRAVRSAAGKPDIATVRMEAAYQGNQVVIRVSDDGAGLDYESIRESIALHQPGADTSGMSNEALADMIFKPGFSTSRTISEVSGRGVGLDVVKGNILDLKGSVRVASAEKGVGTTFLIHLPLTMAVTQALLFDVGGRRFATALYDIKEILRVNPDDMDTQGEKSIMMDGRRMPYYELSEYLSGAVDSGEVAGARQWPLVLIIDTGSWRGAVAIDRIIHQREVVIKSLGSHLHHVRGIAGATVMGDGKVIPILNLEELLNAAADIHLSPEVSSPRELQRPLEIMVVDDSVSVRMVVSRLLQRQGWRVQTAKDGVEAMERLHDVQPDLIVLDVEMPRMNGYEFMSSMRSQSAFKETPVVMLTSRATRKHRQKAEALGVNGFVTKPYDDDAFVALIKRLSAHRRPST